MENNILIIAGDTSIKYHKTKKCQEEEEEEEEVREEAEDNHQTRISQGMQAMAQTQ